MDTRELALTHTDQFSVITTYQETTAEQLWVFVTEQLLAAETRRYTGGNSAEHKLLFLIGGPEHDVAVAQTSRGERIYTKQPAHPKAPEVLEATAAISFYFEVEPDVVRVVSELTDVFFNLALLTRLDPKFSAEYTTCVHQLADALGVSLRDALLLTAAKYAYRLIDPGVKNSHEEDRLIQKLMTPQENNPAVVPRPSEQQIATAYRVLNRIGNHILRTRLQQLQHWSHYGFPPNGLSPDAMQVDDEKT